MKLLHDANEGFELFIDSSGTYTGCLWQTAIMHDNFDGFGGLFCIDAMKQRLKIFLWPYVYINMYNEMEQVCFDCEGIF